MNNRLGSIGLLVLPLIVFCGFLCCGGENKNSAESGHSQGAGFQSFLPGPKLTVKPRASERTAGVKVRDGVLRFLTLKGPSDEELEERRLEKEMLDTNSTRLKHNPPLPPVDKSGKAVAGWEGITREDLKRSPRNIYRYLRGLPPVG